MYCRKCGKFIDYDAQFCKECESVEVFFSDDSKKEGQTQNQNGGTMYEMKQPFQQNDDTMYAPMGDTGLSAQGNKREGFGRALTSTLLGAGAYLLSMILFSIFDISLYEMEEYFYYQTSSYYGEAASIGTGLSVTWIILATMSVAMSIVSIIFGAKSMATFFRAKRAGRVKPVATLVLGIVGIATSGAAICVVLGSVALFGLIGF